MDLHAAVASWRQLSPDATPEAVFLLASQLERLANGGPQRLQSPWRPEAAEALRGKVEAVVQDYEANGKNTELLGTSLQRILNAATQYTSYT
jgi:hypothetical protein